MRKETREERKLKITEMAESLYPLYMAGDIDELGKVSTEIIDLEKGHVSALTFKGIYFREIGRNKNALKFLEHAVKIDPQDKFALVHKASLLNVFKKHNQALKVFDQALAQDPTDAQIINMKGITFSKMSKNEEALIHFVAAIKLEPDNLIFRLNKGQTQIKLKDFWGAHESLDKVLALEPDNLKALIEKILCFTEGGRFKEASLVVSKAMKVDNKHSKTFLTMSFLHEKWNHMEKCLAFAHQAQQLRPDNLYPIILQVRLLYKMKRVEEAKLKFMEFSEKVNDDMFEKLNEERVYKYSDPRIKYIKELIQKAHRFRLESENFDPSKNLYFFLQQKEFLDFFACIVHKIELALNEDCFVPEKVLRRDLKNVEDALNSRSMDFKMKQDLEYIDKSPIIETYKRTMIRLLIILKESVRAAQMDEFSVEKPISMIEFNFICLFWNETDFESKSKEFFEWKNFRNYINILFEKYDDLFTDKFWKEALDWAHLLKEDRTTRKRIENFANHSRFKEYKSRDIKQRILKLYPDHFLGDLDLPGEELAFVDLDQMKEILSRSFFPKKHPYKLKLQNLLHYLYHPEDYQKYKGSIMLRNAESIKKDHEEIKKIMLDEALQLKGITYDSKVTFTPWAKTDVMEITIDSFLREPFELKFEGFPVDKKINFSIPSSNYELMVNLKIKGRVNLFRKVSFQVHDLKRGCMNFVDIFEEMQLDKTVTHLEKSGTIGLYIL